MAKRRRRELTLCIDHGAKVWLARYAKKNLWRVRSWYDLEDLIQEGFMVFCRVLDKYRDTVKSQAHLMRLFQVAVTNHFNNLSKERTRDPVQVLATDLETAGADIAWMWDQLVQCDDHLMTILVAQAPEQVRQVFAALVQADGSQLRSSYRLGKNGRETSNERLCRLANLDPEKVDVSTAIRDYLTQNL